MAKNRDALHRAQTQHDGWSTEMVVDFGRDIDVDYRLDYVVSGQVSANKKLTDETNQLTYSTRVFVIDTADANTVYETKAKLTKTR